MKSANCTLSAIAITLIFSAGILSQNRAHAAPSQNNPERAAFFLAMSKQSKSSAYSVFLLEQLLTSKCGAIPSISFLKRIELENGYTIMRALNAGNYDAAEQRLNAIPCETK